MVDWDVRVGLRLADYVRVEANRNNVRFSLRQLAGWVLFNMLHNLETLPFIQFHESEKLKLKYSI